VKLNQRLRELDGVEQVFVHPNMGDGGCGTGAALLEYAGNGHGAAVNQPLDERLLRPGVLGGRDRRCVAPRAAAVDEVHPDSSRRSHLL
jgi:hypothetical protein